MIPPTMPQSVPTSDDSMNTPLPPTPSLTPMPPPPTNLAPPAPGPMGGPPLPPGAPSPVPAGDEYKALAQPDGTVAVLKMLPDGSGGSVIHIFKGPKNPQAPTPSGMQGMPAGAIPNK